MPISVSVLRYKVSVSTKKGLLLLLVINSTSMPEDILKKTTELIMPALSMSVNIGLVLQPQLHIRFSHN